MVKLTASQKKKLKLHAVNQSASHMKKMVKLMREGDSFSEAHATASKKSVKQKQKQQQQQKVVINLAPSRRRRAPPRQTARPNTSRVLQQFAQPTAMLPQQQYTIYPVSLPPAFQRIQSPVLTNQNAPRPDGVVEGRILGSAPLESPLMPSQGLLSAMASADKLLSGRQQPDNTASQGRTLLPNDVRQYQNILAATRGYESNTPSAGGVSSLSETEPELFTPRFTRGSATETGLGRVEESDDESFGGSGGTGIPSPSLMRR